jgi:ribosomal protein S26
MDIRCLLGHKPYWEVQKSKGMKAKLLKCERCGRGIPQDKKYSGQSFKEKAKE